MAVIETWFNQDLQKPVKVQYIDGSLFSNNGNGNRIGVNVFDNGEPVTLTGSVSGYAVLSDGTTVPCTGARTGNKASILVPPAAYVPGAMFISVFLTDGTTVTTLAAVSTYVLLARTDTQVDPGSVVTDWTQTINGAMQDVQTAAANLGQIVATPYPSLTYPVPLGKYTYYNGNLYRCVSPIASSENFTPAHWSSAINLGDEVSDLKSAISENSFDILRLYGTFQSKTTEGIVFTPIKDGFLVNRTAAGSTTARNNVYYNTSALPDGVVPGKNMLLEYVSTAATAANIGFYDSNGNLGTTVSYTSSAVIAVPSDAVGMILRIQIAKSASPSNDTIKIRLYPSVRENFPYQEFLVNDQIFSGTDANSISGNAWYFCYGTTVSNCPTNTDSYYVCNLIISQYTKVQMAVRFTDGACYYRKYASNAWGNWSLTGEITNKQIYSGSDANAINVDSWYFCDSSNVSNCPEASGSFYIRTLLVSQYVKVQIAVNFTNGKIYYRRYRSGAWETWITASGSNNTYNNYNTFNEYSNTYNVTASPSITTDTNNYLESTGDTTDVTASIVAMLTETGVCNLGPGVFYVSGVQMPDNSMIRGSGSSTEIVLSGTGDGFAIKLGSNCVVKDLQITGAGSDITLSETVGARHGILWQGDYRSSQSTANQPKDSKISNLYIRRFSGGGISCYDTGMGTANMITADGISITNCNAGIYIPFISEFNKFSNIKAYGCYYGCINNGGNNMFTNCDFSNNQLAFLMDNVNYQANNNSHGTCSACVFNHSASNAGIGIKILNCANGFVFTGCQIFFSQIDIENSSGVTIANSNFGNVNCSITVNGGGAILFANNMHQADPTKTITDNTHVHFANCYVRSTGAIVTN